MARIRSIHPGLFTDEAFMALSSDARVLLFGLWCEADDQGIFEWKPLTLKARILPVNDVDVMALLTELAAGNVIGQFTADDKTYGAVRNFRKFQRPQKPTAQFPLPEHMALFVGLSGTPIVPLPESSDSPPVKSPQMEDVGGKREDVGEKEPSSLRSDGRVDESFFTRFRGAYPRRDGANPWKPARDRFRSACKSGFDPEAIIAGADSYRQHCEATGIVGTPYVAQAQTWLNQQRWADDYAAPCARTNGKLSAEEAELLAKHTPSPEKLAELRKQQEDEWLRNQS